jgi:uncharacterized membrane protein
MTQVESKARDVDQNTFVFRWRYVVPSLVVVLVAVVASIYFYHLLPDRLAYQVTNGNSADKSVGRDWFIVAMVLPQFLLTLAGASVAWAIARAGRRYKETGKAKAAGLSGMITVMSNMVVLPQLVLCFALIDVFSYNAYQVHLLPLWVFAMLVMLVGGFVLAIFFFRAVQQAKIAR